MFSYITGMLSALVGAVISGLIFKTYFVSATQKLSYFILCTLLLALTSILPLYSSTFSTLLLVVSIRQFLGQILEIPCQGKSLFPCGQYLSQHVKADLDKKLDPKQKTIQTFNIDAQGFRKPRNENPLTW